MRRLLVLALLLLVGPVWGDGLRTATYNYGYDVDSATVTYCRLEGKGGEVFNAAPMDGPAKIKTTGSSANVTAVTALSAPFANVGLGDVIISGIPGATPDVRVVIVRTDADNVTLSGPVTWETDAQGNTGRTFKWLNSVCGTTATAGWIDVSGASEKLFEVNFEQGDIDGLEWRIECKSAALGGAPDVVFPGTATACGGGSVASGYCRFAAATAGIAGRYMVQSFDSFSACRIGMKYQSTDTSDTSAEMVTNGTFTGNANGWTLGGGGGAPDWAYAANNVTHGNAGGTTALEPSTPLTVVVGHAYQVTFTVSGWSAGTVTASIGGASGTARGADGTFVETLVATTTGNLLFTPTTTLVATLDTVSVVDITGTLIEQVSASVTLGRQ